MNKLTDRLQLMAEQINKGESVADIGTDHGFLPLYLFEEGISPKVIMCDISRPSLAKAEEAFAMRFPDGCSEAEDGSNCYDFRAGDGLKVLSSGEVSTVVIAGMGGILIRDIMADDISVTKSFGKFILQPRNNSGQLRYWLCSNGFRITDNLLVREGKFICEIIVAMADDNTERPDAGPESASWDFPNELIDRYPELGADFARVKLGIEEKIRDGMMKSCNACEGDIRAVEKRMEYYRGII